MTILVVDDEASIRNICQRALRAAGHAVSTAASGDEAAGRLGENWDIIVTDITMPGTVDGFELLRRAKKSGSSDVLIMTGYPELDFAIRALKLGAYDFIIKPFGPEVLRAGVQRCLDKRELSAELAREKALRAEVERAHSELTRMQKVKDTFGIFVTPEVADYVLASGEDFHRMNVKKTVTVLFADVRGFTPFAAGVPPDVAMDTLNAVFSSVIPAVQNEGGILNKFMGDGLLALFGAPLDLDGHEQAAARAALCAIKAVEDSARAGESRGLPQVRIGIGINTGEVIAGCLGVQNRTEYSVIGHTVNLASRLNGAAKPGQILLGSGTAKALGETFQCRRLEVPVNLSGIAEPGDIWELLGQEAGAQAKPMPGDRAQRTPFRQEDCP